MAYNLTEEEFTEKKKNYCLKFKIKSHELSEMQKSDRR